MPRITDEVVARAARALADAPPVWTRVDPSAPPESTLLVGWTPAPGEDVVLVRMGVSQRVEAAVVREMIEERIAVRAVLLAAGYEE